MTRLRYVVLWAVSVIAMVIGVGLLIAGWTTIRVPDPSDTAHWIAQPMSLAGPGTGLLVGGGVLAVILLILDTYVRPVHRRTAELEPAEHPPAD